MNLHLSSKRSAPLATNWSLCHPYTVWMHEAFAFFTWGMTASHLSDVCGAQQNWCPWVCALRQPCLLPHGGFQLSMSSQSTPSFCHLSRKPLLWNGQNAFWERSRCWLQPVHERCSPALHVVGAPHTFQRSPPAPPENLRTTWTYQYSNRIARVC